MTTHSDPIPADTLERLEDGDEAALIVLLRLRDMARLQGALEEAVEALERIAEPHQLYAEKEVCYWCRTPQGHDHHCPTLLAKRTLTRINKEKADE